MTGPRVELVQQADGEWHYRVLGRNGEYLFGNGSQGGQGSRDAADATRALRDAAAAMTEALDLGNVDTLPLQAEELGT